MPAIHENNGGFDFSPFINLPPYQKISLLKTLIKDPSSSDSYPDYIGRNSDGSYVYRTKDLNHSYFISNDEGAISIFTTQSSDVGLGAGGLKSSVKGKYNYDMPYDGGASNWKGSAAASLDVNGAIYKNENQYIKIYDDGHKFSGKFSESLMDFKGKLEPFEDKKIGGGLDLVSVKADGLYYPPPNIVVNSFDSSDVRFSQNGYGGSLGASFNIGSKLSPISLDAKPNIDFEFKELAKVNDYNTFLTDKDRLIFQNDGIKDLLNNSQSPEDADLSNALQLSDPNTIGAPPANDKTIITDEKRKELEDKLLQNEEKLKAFESVNEDKDDLNLDDKNSSSLDDDPLKKMIEVNKTDASSITPKDLNKNDSQNSLGSTPTPLTQTGNNGNTLSNNLDHKSDHITLSYDEIFHDIQENINQLNNNLAKS